MSRFFASRERNRAKEQDLDPHLVFPKGLKILQDSNDALIDIVFVHGLTGDRERTWTSPGVGGIPGPCWPKEWLPASLPMCRIMTFGYDAYVARLKQKVSRNRLYNHSADLLNALVGRRNSDATVKRPIIFITHSMGGIVCKDAIRSSRDAIEIYLQDVYKSVRGVMFLATPHAGSWLANWAKLPAKVLGLFHQTDRNLLSILETDSELLRRVHASFLNLLRARERLKEPILIACLYETLPLIGNTLIVDEDSAVIPGYNSVSVHADHRNIARFQHVSDPGFISIVQLLRTWTLEIGQAMSTTTTTKQTTPQLSQQTLLAPATSVASSTTPSGNRIWRMDPIEEAEIKRNLSVQFIESLEFPGMNTRETYIERAANKTCGWLFETDVFETWLHRKNLETTHGILWIKGKPGSGKSTMLKYLLEILETKLNNSNSSNRPVLRHFFNARGTELERSEEGLYRSLLAQICRKIPYLCLLLCKTQKDKIQASIHTPLTWHVTELRQMLQDCFIRWDLETDIVIDALDECPDDEAREVVHTLADIASAVRKRPRMCWSSRHYPHISITNGLEIFMETFNRLDIERYVTQKLSYSALLSSDSSFATQIVSKSNGVFLWTALVTRQLLKAADQGRTFSDIRDILSKTPSDLFEIYEGILLSLDTQLKEETLRLIQWVMFSLEPLSISVLQAALAYGAPNVIPSLGDWALSLEKSQSLQAPEVDRERYWHYYITERSGGLFELMPSKIAAHRGYTESDDSHSSLDQDHRLDIAGREREAQYHRRTDKYLVVSEHLTLLLPDRSPTGVWTPIVNKQALETSFVQIIHQSVQDFLLDQHTCGVLNSSSRTGFVEASNYQLFKACARFLLSSELTCALSTRRARQLWPGSEPKLIVDGRSWLNHVFTGYAHDHIWDHLRRARIDFAASKPSPAERDLIRRALKQWWSLEISRRGGVFSQGARSYDKQKDTSHRYWLDITQKLVDLEILTERQALDGRNCAENFHEGYIAVIKTGFPLKGRVRELAFIAAASHGHTNETLAFIKRQVNVNCVDLKGDTAIVGATRGGYATTVQLLIHHAALLDSTGTWNESPLFVAVRQGELEIAKLLCGNGASVHGRNWAHETAMHVAAFHGHMALIELLMQHGAECDSVDQYGDTPLFKAIRANQFNVVQSLLRFRANPNHRNKSENTPLHECAHTGHFEIARTLINHGAEYETAGWCGTSPLYVAALHKHDKRIQMLFEKGSRRLIAAKKDEQSSQTSEHDFCVLGDDFQGYSTCQFRQQNSPRLYGDTRLLRTQETSCEFDTDESSEEEPIAQHQTRSKMSMAKAYIASVLIKASDADDTSNT